MCISYIQEILLTDLKKQKSHQKQQDLKDFIFGSKTELSFNRELY